MQPTELTCWRKPIGSGERAMDLFDGARPWRSPSETAALLTEHHYLGPTKRGSAYVDDIGVIVVASPTGRRLPADWLEVTRWCIIDRSKNAGSRQWGRFIRALRKERPEITTLVSYSDPSAGHDGALYRACNWIWAPTWHRLRPPPSGNGSWKSGKQESVKDRWVFPIAPDDRRETLLVAQDPAILRKMPWARYSEPAGASYRLWKKHASAG